MEKKIKYIVAAIGMTVLASTQAALLGEYTFNDLGAGTIEERLPVALQSSSVATGASLSVLGTNTIQQLDFMGFNNISWPNVSDSFSFGNNDGQAVMFFHRADLADPLTPTAWGPGGVTAASHSPLSFTLAADAFHNIVVSNILVGTTGAIGSATLWTLQEENAAQGAFVVIPGSPGSATVGLSNTVVVAAGTSKTFTISMDSYVHGAAQFVDYIKVNGSIAEGGIPEVGILEISPVDTNVLKLVVGASPDQAQFYHPESATDLPSALWAAVAHSDGIANAYVVTNLSYSVVEGTHIVIYVKSEEASEFCRIKK